MSLKVAETKRKRNRRNYKPPPIVLRDSRGVPVYAEDWFRNDERREAAQRKAAQTRLSERAVRGTSFLS